VQLGAGVGIGLSPDGKWALARLRDSRTKLVMLPTGAGELREISTAGLMYSNAGWFPDGKRIVFIAQNEGEPQAAYVQDVTNSTPRRITTAVSFATGDAAPLRVSPDGQWFTGPQTDGPPVLVPIGGGGPRHLPGLTIEDRPLNWSADGRTIFIERGVPDKRWATSIIRYDLATSHTTPVRQIELSDAAGMSERPWCLITPDGRVIVYVVNRHLTDLYVVEGLR
jgi:Tol biopolymer transport system component